MKVKWMFGVSLLAIMPIVSPADEVEPVAKAVNKVLFGNLVQGWDIKAISRAGDAAAVAVTKLVGDRPLEPQQVESVLYVLNAAFSQPELIESPDNKEPSTALFVLRYLDAATLDPSLKSKITESTRKLRSLSASRSAGRN